MSTAPTQPSQGDRPRVYLASRSPRRRELLAQAGIDHDAAHPGIDDGELPTPAPGVSPEHWVIALAYLKARSAMQQRDASTASLPPALVLGADTTVVHDEADEGVLGQPADEEDARRMLRALRGRAHDVVTGVALIDSRTGRRTLFADRARVSVGELTDEQIESYLSTGQWRGKAGAYNLAERIAAGWPITVDGDPGTVMGLPIRKLARLVTWASRPCTPSA